MSNDGFRFYRSYDWRHPSLELIFQNEIKNIAANFIDLIFPYVFITQDIANTEKLRFTNESVAVRQEAAKLKSEGVDIVIVLSHCGLDVDYIIAKNAGPDVDVIVGGHSHTFMYTNKSGEHPPGPDTPQDKYPAVVTHDDGHKVLIVQASAYLKYVGDITVYFDRKGRVVSWEGAPIFLDTNIVQGMSTPWIDFLDLNVLNWKIYFLVRTDPDIIKELKPWREIVGEQGNKVVGTLRVPLLKSRCNYAECNLGNVIADSYVHHYATTAPISETNWTPASIALIGVGGLRTTLSKGRKFAVSYTHRFVLKFSYCWFDWSFCSARLQWFNHSYSIREYGGYSRFIW